MSNRQDARVAHAARDPVPKLCGADIELANFIAGPQVRGESCSEAALALLREIDGLPAGRGTPQAQAAGYGVYAHAYGTATGDRGYALVRDPCGDGDDIPDPSAPYDPQEWGRKFLPATGGSAYIDLAHLEVCLPEVLSAYDHVAAWHGMLRTVQRALAAANAERPPGERIHVLANNSDGLGNAYGSHLDFMIARRTWDDLFARRPHLLLYLAAFQASSIVFTGQGKVGSENGRPHVDYQIAQRPDFYECLTGVQTTHRRPLVNSRDEALCGRGQRSRTAHERLARLHCIFFDNALCPVSSLLRVGTMQLALALVEAGAASAHRLLDDPVEAVVRWSHDPSLSLRLETAAGSALTAVDHQRLIAEDAARFVARGGADGIVPRAAEIVELWQDTLEKLAAREVGALARRLDWVRKLVTLESVLAERPDLDWRSPGIKRLDHLYSSLDPEEGLYLAFEAAGEIDRVVPEERVAHLAAHPPDDTRAWTRAMLLRAAPAQAIDAIDWDAIRFAAPSARHRIAYRTIELDDPLSFTRADAEPIFARATTLAEILDGLDELPERAGGARAVHHTAAPRAAGGGSHAAP